MDHTAITVGQKRLVRVYAWQNQNQDLSNDAGREGLRGHG